MTTDELRALILDEMTPGEPRSAALELADARTMGVEPNRGSVRVLRDWTLLAWSRNPVSRGAIVAASILDSIGHGSGIG